MSKPTPLSREYKPGTPLMVFQRINNLPCSGDEKRMAKRVIRAIERHPHFYNDPESAMIGFRDGEEKIESVWIPWTAREREWIWTYIEKDIAGASIAQEKVLGDVAEELGQRKQFAEMIAETEPGDIVEQEGSK